MAEKLIGAGLASIGQVGVVYSADANGNPPFPLGSVQEGDAGGTYIFLQGIGSTVVGSAVSYGLSATSAFLTALTVTGVRGPIAIACAAVVATKFGWYQIGGLASANFNGAAVAGAKLYSAGTGLVDDAVVSGDQISGAIVAATVSGSGLGAVFLSGPFMNGLG